MRPAEGWPRSETAIAAVDGEEAVARTWLLLLAILRHALHDNSTTPCAACGPWSYRCASEREITRLSPDFAADPRDFIEGRKWAMRLTGRRHALAVFGADTAPAGAPFGRIARAVSKRITHGTSDVGRPGSPGCLCIRPCAGNHDAGRAIGARPNAGS